MSRRVLIVEDEVIVAEDLSWQLTQLGYEVVGTAASGTDAISFAKSKMPDILMMDVRLQGEMSGTEAAEIILSNPTRPGIIFLSAFADNPDGLRKDKGIIYLTKPYSAQRLKAALQELSGLDQS